MNKKFESHNLDFLRAIAVLLVFGRHLYGQLIGDFDGIFRTQLFGVLGVWFFFVHTSIVLMFSIETQAKTRQSTELYLAFLIRRTFRIFPLTAFTIAIVFCVGSAWKGNPIASLDELSVPVLIANIFLVQNIFQIRDVIGPLWSLPIEFQMYLFLPFLWLIATRSGWRLLAFVIWPLAVVLGLAVSQTASRGALGVIVYAPCFIPGVLCYSLWRKSNRYLPFIALPILLTILLITYLLLGRLSKTGGAWIVCMALGTALPWIREMQSELLRRACKVIAKYSFGIYLLHDICIPISIDACGKNAHWTVVAFTSILSSAAFAYFAYHAIEEPFIQLGAKLLARINSAKLSNA